jgi:hypothetical protein
MKKEASIIDVDKEYELEKYGKSEFVLQVQKEFRKYGKKLSKIASYEVMEKEGKPLNQEMKELMAKKEQFNNHLKSLKSALDLFAKSGTVMSTQEQLPVTKDTKLELQDRIKEATEKASKRLSFLMAIASTLQHKNLLLNPFGHSSFPTPEQIAAFQKLYKSVVSIREDNEITLAEEARRIFEDLNKFLAGSNEGIDLGEGRKPSYAELLSVVDQIAENKEISELLRFKVIKKDEAYVQPAVSKPQYVEAPAPKVTREERAPVPVPEPVRVQPPHKQEETKSSWAAEVEEDEEPKVPEKKPEPEIEEPKPAEVVEEKPKEPAWEKVMDKKDKRQERMADRERRYRRGRGGYGRGEGFRGERRDRRGGRRGGRYQARGEGAPETQAAQ